MDMAMLDILRDVMKSGGEAVLCTVVDEKGSAPRGRGAAMIVRPDGTSVGSTGGGEAEHRVIEAAVEMMRNKRRSDLMHISLEPKGESPGAACGGEVSIFLERYGDEPRVLIFGAGHVGRALARLANASGFAVTVWDDRADIAEWCAPWAEVISCPLEEVFDHGVSTGPLTCTVIVTRGHAMDADATRVMQGHECAYIGMIGSKNKIAYVRERLIAEGVPADQIDRIKKPIGIPIGAETPEEIAISIMAEIIASLRGADLEALRSGWA